MDTKDQIKEHLDIVDVINEYVRLTKAGSNFKGLCPFHNEKSPSFMVSQDKQMFHCFGCGEGGDVISFVQKIEHADFREALKILAPKAGVTLNELQYDKNFSKKQRLFELNDSAANFYHQVLLNAAAAKHALEYVRGRGIGNETIKGWRIGYAPNAWHTTQKALHSKNFFDNDLVEAGIAVRNEKGRVYDRFRDRITFPITDINGKVVGFTTRLLKEDDPKAGGKYINTPETLIFNKSRVLFGLDRAKKSIRGDGFVVLVEGNVDVIMSHQAGVTNVVATSGTALTTEHAQLLSRYTDTAHISFDNDEAGIRAASKAIEVLSGQGFNIRVIELPKEMNGVAVKDPDDCIRQDPGRWQEAAKHAIPLMEWFMQRVESMYDMKDPQQKSKGVSYLLEKVSHLPDRVQKQHWVGVIAQRIDVPESVLSEALEGSSEARGHVPVAQLNSSTSREDTLVETMYSLLISHPDELFPIFSDLTLDNISRPSLKRLANELFLYYNKDRSFDYREFSRHLEQKDETLYDTHQRIALVADRDFGELEMPALIEEAKKIVLALNNQFQQQQIKELQKQLSHAEQEQDDDRIRSIMQQIKDLRTRDT